MSHRCYVWLFYIPKSTFQPTERFERLLSNKFIKEFKCYPHDGCLYGHIRFQAPLSYSAVFLLFPECTKIVKSDFRSGIIFRYNPDDFYDIFYYKNKR